MSKYPHITAAEERHLFGVGAPKRQRTHAVVAAYDHLVFGPRGTVVSRHYSSAAAERAARNDCGFLAVREI
jgi:hypothetical protein